MSAVVVVVVQFDGVLVVVVQDDGASVSYTHLTLPTMELV